MIRNALIVLPLLLASTAFAADPTPAAPATTAPATTTPATPAANPTFVSLDKNKDAGLDKTEISTVAPVVAAFATLDADKNGKLSEAEYKAWADKAPAAAPAAPAKK